MQLSVVIVNYNVRHFLEQALLSVRHASVGLDLEVWVVDNNSVDDSVQMVREKFPEVKVIANKHNPGFSIANNQAIRQSKGKYILLLNPDTVVEEDTFSKCIDFMDAHPDAGGLGVKMIDGGGNFLPESKRGFPSPWVAFCKTFGLSKIFPKSPKFNRYHLGYLDKDENHEIDVLAGAFMMMRKETLDKVGLLDETFFMYGEDIDLSYRIVKGGYKNYYFSDTTIIHYKGESTKKGSLNYVRVFYQAMIIFAKKHFTGEGAFLFIAMLQFAIYFRAFITLLGNFWRAAALPIIEGIIMALGLHFIKDFWAQNYYSDADYYDDSFYYVNVPLYITLWLAGIFFSGGYDEKYNFRRVVRGLLIGTLVLAAVYGFLPLEYRPSRAIIVMGATFALVSSVLIRTVFHFLEYKNLRVGHSLTTNLIIVGSTAESERVQHLLAKAQVRKNYIGTVAPSDTEDRQTYLSSFAQLEEAVRIYKANEIIFCSKDVSAQNITKSMTALGPTVDYKILPEESLSIIGSSSKNTSGELYTINIQFNIARKMLRRNKRLFDLLATIILLITLPINIIFVKSKLGYLRNLFYVLIGKKTWIGYAKTQNTNSNLPKIKSAVLSPLDGITISQPDEPTVQRLNFLYAKDYGTTKDLEIIMKGFSNCGQ
jgi:GT2 family glycosyltransferase